MRYCIKFTPSPSHSGSPAVAALARRQGLSPTEKKSSSQAWDHQNEGLLLGLVAGVNIKSRSHMLVISDVQLKRASGDFPLAGVGVPGSLLLLLKCPSLPPSKPDFFQMYM